MLIFSHVNMKIKFQINQLKEVSVNVKKNINTNIVLISGEMGVGKTTLIKEIFLSLNVIDNVSSPTFSIVNEYKIKGSSVFHFDFYRIENEFEALDIGVEDYISQNNWCFLEWAEKIPNLIPSNVNYINFKHSDDSSRTIEIDLNE